ncbi:MAG: spermidine synthase, partial [halophilic archaeon J07HX5]
MTEPESYSFRRYLDAKQTVDERARDTRVEETFRSALADHSRLRICEIGAGTGTTAQAVHEWTDVPVEYHAVDVDQSLLDVATARATDTDDRFDITVHAADALDHLAAASEPYDVVIGQAFLDITNVRSAMEAVSASLAAGGVGYFPITFDGVTRFLPSIDTGFDDRIERRFHE